MANYFNLVLDTTGPANPSISINGGAYYSTADLVDLTIGTGDGNTSGYQMKIWGDVDLANDNNIQDTEANSTWITYSTSKQVKLSSADGQKTLNLKLRDDVHNESAQVSDSIIKDTTLPVVTISGPDVSKISKITGKNESSFSFQADSEFEEYKVKVVSSTGASHDTGTLIPTTNGSSNMSEVFVSDGAMEDSAGHPANDPITCVINGADLELASAGDGNKIIKVFVKDDAGNWSA